MDIAAPTRQQLESLLRFYAEAGLDFPIEADAADRFAGGNAPMRPAARPETTDRRNAAPPSPTPSPSPQPAAVIPDANAVALAEAAAAGAADLDQLAAAVAAFEGCNLKRGARATVFEGGRRGAELMVVFGAPSRDDDAAGDAFCGPDGILLRKMMGAIGIAVPDGLYAGFCVPWMVPGGGQPTELHLKICAPFLARQIALARPKLVVALGNAPVRHLLGAKRPIHVSRGQWTQIDTGGGPVPAIAMFEPAFLRDQPRFKREAWLDLLAISERLRTG